MPTDFESLWRATTLRPTSLLLGAGASIPSGAPTAGNLAGELATAFLSDGTITYPLPEMAEIVECEHGRAALEEWLRDRFKTLRPQGGIELLPQFPWKNIYSTNYDLLVEDSYRAKSVPYLSVRNNYEFSKFESGDQTRIIKLHGCISTPYNGHSDSQLVITESDYDRPTKYRDFLFDRLKLDLAAQNIVIIGQSLADKHLKDLVRQAGIWQDEHGLQNRVWLVLYSEDSRRAQIFERANINVIFGALDTFLEAGLRSPSHVDFVATLVPPAARALPEGLRDATIAISDEITATARTNAMFAGKAATYVDISGGWTFQRDLENAITSRFAETPIMAVIGAAGVGKTTMCRRVVHRLWSEEGYLAYEHKRDMPLNHAAWIDFAHDVKSRNEWAVLYVDDADRNMVHINMLAEALADLKDCRLYLLVSSETSAWKPRQKSVYFYDPFPPLRLLTLSKADIGNLLRLLQRNAELHRLCQPAFLELDRTDQVNLIEAACRADMFVALYRIFASDSLDTILLREFAELPQNAQAIYRLTAALETMGIRARRQIVMQILNIEQADVPNALDILEDLVLEDLVDPDDAIYLWQTRHEVISERITKYKYPSQKERIWLCDQIIDNLNPSLKTDRGYIAGLCNEGIRAVEDPNERRRLYRKLVHVDPGHRVPRHRLVWEALQAGDLYSAETIIADAEAVIGVDGPMCRYKVLLAIGRAQTTEGLLFEDRVAILRQARELAEAGIRRYRDNKYLYKAFGEVAGAYVTLTSDFSWCADAVDAYTRGEQRIKDPDLSEWKRVMEGRLSEGVGAQDKGPSGNNRSIS